MRLQRLNYDKARRCPTWSGPALRGPIPKYEDTCPGGMITFTNKDGDLKKFYKFRFFACPECGVTTLPYYLGLVISPSIWFYQIKRNWSLR